MPFDDVLNRQLNETVPYISPLRLESFFLNTRPTLTYQSLPFCFLTGVLEMPQQEAF
jgi:hypothetical protein